MNLDSKIDSKILSLHDGCYPILGVIEVTNHCNAGCAYCFIENRYEETELSTSQICTVIDKLASAGIFFLNITGGEAFSRPDIDEILIHAFHADFFAVSIYTNGTLINQDHINLLEKYKQYVHPLRMTVFSHLEDVHDDYMKIPGSFRSILAAGKELQKRGVEVQLALPLMDFNHTTLSETFDFFKQQGLPIGLSHQKLITPANNTSTMWDMTSETFFLSTLKHSGSVVNIDADTYSSECKSDSSALCRGIHESVMIDIHGQIHPCTAFRNFILGSIFEDGSLNEILQKNKRYLSLKKLTKNDLVCKTCEFTDHCAPCIAMNHNLSGTFTELDEQYCHIKRAIKAFTP